MSRLNDAIGKIETALAETDILSLSNSQNNNQRQPPTLQRPL